MELFTAQQLSRILGVTKRAISYRAKRENWEFEISAARGGNIPHFPYLALPKDIRDVVCEVVDGISSPEKQADRIATNESVKRQAAKQKIEEAKLESLKIFSGLTGKHKDKAEIAFFILNTALDYAKTQSSKVLGLTNFADSYNKKDLDLPSRYYEMQPSLSYKTLSRWEKVYRENGIIGLVPGYGKSKGKGLIDSIPEMRDFCIALINKYPHIEGGRLAEFLEMQFGEIYTVPGVRTCRRWLAKWKEENAATFMSLMDPSGWQNKYMAAFGSMSAQIERINQLWEFDSTPADVMLTDGRYSIVGVIDVFTRRVKVVLKPTSNSEAIALLVRDAILDWGIPEVARTDNGADYLSAHIRTIWDGLGIHNDITNPYSGWEKPFIERFFRTFSHGIAEMLDGYIGHNVAEREKINARLTFAKRLMAKREKGAGNENIDVALSAEQFEAFINSWLEAHYHHNKHSELGCTPFEKFSQHKQTIQRLDDERALDILLAPVPGQKGIRTVGKEGISIEGMKYIHAELGAYVGERVFCRYNPDDVGKVYVFHSLHGHFICEAVNPEIAGNDISMAHAQEAKRVQKAKLRDERKRVKQASKQHELSDLAQKYVEYRASQTNTLTSFPKQSSKFESDTVNSIVMANNVTSGYSQEKKDDLARKREELEAIEAARKADCNPIFNNDHEKARYFTDRNTNGLLSPTEKAWLHQYRRDNPKAASMLDKLYQQTK